MSSDAIRTRLAARQIGSKLAQVRLQAAIRALAIKLAFARLP